MSEKSSRKPSLEDVKAWEGYRLDDMTGQGAARRRPVCRNWSDLGLAKGGPDLDSRMRGCRQSVWTPTTAKSFGNARVDPALPLNREQSSRYSEYYGIPETVGRRPELRTAPPAQPPQTRSPPDPNPKQGPGRAGATEVIRPGKAIEGQAGRETNRGPRQVRKSRGETQRCVSLRFDELSNPRAAEPDHVLSESPRDATLRLQCSGSDCCGLTGWVPVRPGPVRSGWSEGGEF